MAKVSKPRPLVGGSTRPSKGDEKLFGKGGKLSTKKKKC